MVAMGLFPQNATHFRWHFKCEREERKWMEVLTVSREALIFCSPGKEQLWNPPTYPSNSHPTIRLWLPWDKSDRGAHLEGDSWEISQISIEDSKVNLFYRTSSSVLEHGNSGQNIAGVSWTFRGWFRRVGVFRYIIFPWYSCIDFGFNFTDWLGIGFMNLSFIYFWSFAF